MRFPRYQRYPVWSAGSILAVAVVVAVAAGSAVLFTGRRPLVVELELTLAILALGLFVFLAAGLYRGLRLRRKRFSVPELGKLRGDDGWVSHFDTPHFNADFLDGDAEGCLGGIVVLLVSLVAFVLIGVLIVWVLPIAWGLIVLVALAAWWLCYLALRRVFALSKRCRGDLSRSIAYAGLYTVAYTGWLAVGLGVWHWLARP